MRFSIIEVKRLVWLVLLCVCTGAKAGNVISVLAEAGNPGEELTVSISLDNSDAVSSLQVSIPLDEQLKLVEGSGAPGSRCPNHEVAVGLKDGELQLFVYSNSMADISGSSGVVATFKLKGSLPGSYGLQPSKAVLTTAAGAGVNASLNGGVLTINGARAQYEWEEINFGGVPIGDETELFLPVTNIGNADLVITGVTFSDVNSFSSKTAFPVTVRPGEMCSLSVVCNPKGRGTLSHTITVNCNSSGTKNTLWMKAEPYVINTLTVESARGVSDEEVTIRLTMRNKDAVSGYQVEFDMPESLLFIDGSFTLSNRKQDHVSAVSLDGNTLRILVYSPEDKPFTGNEGEIGSFKVKLNGRESSDLMPTKVVLSATINNVVENVVSNVNAGHVTIVCPYIEGSDMLWYGDVPVTQDCRQWYGIHNKGEAALVVSNIVFTNEHLAVEEVEFPMTLEPDEWKWFPVFYNSLEEVPFDAVMQIHSNDPAMRLKEVKVTGRRFAPNYLNLNVADVSPDEDCTIDVVLDNYDGLQGVQFEIEYPSDYYRLANDGYTLDARAEGMSVTMEQVDEKTQRVLCYFLSGNGVTRGNGKLMSLLLKRRGADVPLGSYNVLLKNVKLGTADLANKNAGYDTQYEFMVTNDPPLTITAKSYTIVYGDNIPEFGFTSDGPAVAGTPDIYCDVWWNSPVGTYPIVISKGSVTNRKTTFVNGTLTITKAPLKIFSGTYYRKQGEENPEFNLYYDGFRYGDWEEVFTTKPTISCAATKDSAPGEYDITIAGAEAQNYDISYTPGKLIVTEADAVHVTARSYTRTYGDENPVFEYDVSGAALDGTPEISCEATATSPAGTYDIIVKQGTVTNYNVTYVKGTLTIEPAPLSISVGSYTKKQGDPMPEFTLTYDGFRNNETKDVLTKQPVISCDATESSAPGTYDIRIAGAEAQNYVITYVNGQLIVTVADAVFITAKDYTRVYGEENPEFGYDVSGAALAGMPELVCEATATSPVGTYDIIVQQGSVTNYNVIYQKGTLTITKAPLAVKTETYTRKQGEENPEFVITYEGWKNNETEDVLTKKPTATTEATKDSAPGEYEIIVSGGEAQNYELSYTNGKLIITERPVYTLTYVVDGETYKTYSVAEGSAITAEAEPTKEGYTFSGWSEIPETMPNHDVTITGTFTINTYKLTYMIDGEVYKVVEYEYGATITPEPQPEGDYVRFEWVSLPETMPAKDVTVNASYETGIIELILSQGNARIYSPNGKKLSKLQKGLNIVIMGDGTIKKVVMK